MSLHCSLRKKAIFYTKHWEFCKTKSLRNYDCFRSKITGTLELLIIKVQVYFNICRGDFRNKKEKKTRIISTITCIYKEGVRVVSNCQTDINLRNNQLNVCTILKLASSQTLCYIGWSFHEDPSYDAIL